MEKFNQRLKKGTHKIVFAECENPKESMLGYKHSKSEENGYGIIVQGTAAIRRFRDWLNKLDI